MELDDWIKALQDQLKLSHVQDAVSRLTEGIVNNAQGFALQMEGRKLMLMMRKLAAEQKLVLSLTTFNVVPNCFYRRQLLEISRSRGEYEQAYRAFQQAQAKFKGLLSICEEESTKLTNSAALKLDKAFAILELNGQKSAVLAVESAAKRADRLVPKVQLNSCLLPINCPLT